MCGVDGKAKSDHGRRQGGDIPQQHGQSARQIMDRLIFGQEHLATLSPQDANHAGLTSKTSRVARLSLWGTLNEMAHIPRA